MAEKRKAVSGVNCFRCGGDHTISVCKVKGKKKATGGFNPSGGVFRCYKCGGVGHRIIDCEETAVKCFKCGKLGHCSLDCWKKEVVCYNCRESSHISVMCPKPKKVKSRGKVDASNAEEVHEGDNLIRGICFINFSTCYF